MISIRCRLTPSPDLYRQTVCCQISDAPFSDATISYALSPCRLTRDMLAPVAVSHPLLTCDERWKVTRGQTAAAHLRCNAFAPIRRTVAKPQIHRPVYEFGPKRDVSRGARARPGAC